MSRDYNIFICYRGNSESGLLAQQIYSTLKYYRNNNNQALFIPFFAPRCIKKGEDFYLEEEKALKQIKIMLLVLAPGFFDNCLEYDDQVYFEIKSACERKDIQFITICMEGYSLYFDVAFDNAFTSEQKDRLRHVNGINFHNIYDFEVEKDLIPVIKRRLNMDSEDERCLSQTIKTEEANFCNSFDDYYHTIDRLMNWLTSMKVKWGSYDNSLEPQIANTVEALLAMKLSGYDKKKPLLYKKSFLYVLSYCTQDGLYSKSLGNSSVVHTSMLLILIEMEKRSGVNNLEINYSLFDTIAKKLWSVRNENSGWGLFFKQTEDDSCSMMINYWVFRALLDCSVIENDQIVDFLVGFYEMENDGTFGFYIGEDPKLIVSSMFLELYYRMNMEVRKKICERFPVGKCIDYIYDTLINKNIQFEVETYFDMAPPLLRIEGKHKSPWHHISISFAMTALSEAYKNGDIDYGCFTGLIEHVDKVLKNNVFVIGDKKSYYQPQNMDCAPSNKHTFPSIYFVIGLCNLCSCKYLYFKCFGKEERGKQ